MCKYSTFALRLTGRHQSPAMSTARCQNWLETLQSSASERPRYIPKASAMHYLNVCHSTKSSSRWAKKQRPTLLDICHRAKYERSRWSHPFGHLGVTYELHLWLVGKPVVDFIFIVIELFSLSPTVETLWAEIGRSRRFSKGGGSLWAQISEGKGHRPPTTVGVRKLEWLPFHVVSKYSQCVV